MKVGVLVPVEYYSIMTFYQILVKNKKKFYT